MNLHDLRPRPAHPMYPVTTELRDYAVRGDGDPYSICLRLKYDGIGDDIHTMPAVKWLIENGYSVTVVGDSFARKCWESLGATFIDWADTDIGWVKENKHLYGFMPSLTQWSIWQTSSKLPKFQQIADLIGAQLPESFSWIDTLKPTFSLDRGYILFAPQSAAYWRSIPEWKRISLFRKLKKKYGDVRYSEMLRGSWLYERALNLLGIKKVQCKDFDELLSLVYNAKGVVGVDSGVSHIAAAFGIPLITLFGLTGADTIIDQFKRYLDAPIKVFQGAGDYLGCNAPCFGKAERGFKGERCCGEYSKPVCLDRIPNEEIIQISELIFT